ncbi:MAG: DUF3298 domain-containing protein [Flammeovirgaceae bacterium]
MDQNFYRQYVGSINGTIPVHCSITKIGEKLRASYYYDRHGIPITLTEGKLAKDGSFSFKEYGVFDQVGSIEALFKGNEIAGFWYNKDKSKELLLTLQEDNSTGQLPFDVFHEVKVEQLIQGDTASPTHTFIQTLLYPSINYQGAHKEAIYTLFDELFKENLSAGNPYRTIANMHQQALTSYREANLEIYQEDPSFSSSMNWSEVAHMDVVYNSQNLLSICQNWYNYTGGAHGNYGANYFVIDLAKGQKVMLKDVIKPQHHVDIAKMLQQKIWEQRNLAKGETLKAAGFDTEEIKPTENFYLTHTGIGFYYSPYQIGPYALGSVDVFLPFKECQDFITAAYQVTP